MGGGKMRDGGRCSGSCWRVVGVAGICGRQRFGAQEVAGEEIDRKSNSISRITSGNFSCRPDGRPLCIMISLVRRDRKREHLAVHHKEIENSLVNLISTTNNICLLSSPIQEFFRGASTPRQPPGFETTGESLVCHLRKSIYARLIFLSSPDTGQPRLLFWNVHHEGQPMPGEEQEDIVMTSTQSILLNMTCPLTGKPIVELENPIRSMDCKHVYEKDPVMHYIISKKPKAPCPVAGCPKFLQEERVICDPLLRIEIDEIHAASKSNEPVTNVHDYTEIDFD
ncbi:E3 SUMO-protein ligase MMS21 [Platanthera guangdongensis]|uniref:E3 SUMO-protein ligase MMS21 n=1 Tax=Platanthera guangdongensis TaxID=2320717 RepID=A0ABR2MVG3_9ASPA